MTHIRLGEHKEQEISREKLPCPQGTLQEGSLLYAGSGQKKRVAVIAALLQL